jgi:hypothetical protein
MEHLTGPRERGQGKDIITQYRNTSKQTHQKATSKAGQGVDCRADLLNQNPHSKQDCPTLLGEELTKQLQLKHNPAINWGNQ